MVVYVLDSEGRQLEATERFGKVRRLLKNKQAKVVNQSPFTIQLLYEIENKGDNLMNNIYEICDNYYATLEALKSEDDAIKESDECKKLYEIANNSDFDSIREAYIKWIVSGTLYVVDKIAAPLNTEYFLLGLSIIFIGIFIVLSFANFKLLSVYNFLSSISILEAYPGNIVLAPDNIILLYNFGLTSISQDYNI